MGHPEQLAFVELVASRLSFQNGLNAIEIGSYDVNGNTRAKFHPSIKWIGVDLAPGVGVDIVNFGHLVDFSNESFDLSISCECFEHDEFWRQTFQNMVRMTKPDGILIFTCASIGRPEHGTTRSQPNLSPGTQSRGLDYYRNLTERDFLQSFDFEEIFSQFVFFYNPITFDLYFVGQKRGFASSSIKLPTFEDVKKIRSLTPFPHKVARLPLYLTVKFLPLLMYNEFAFRYWMLLINIESKINSSRSMRLDNR
jgi:SAM-dependent methyltransferase